MGPADEPGGATISGVELVPTRREATRTAGGREAPLAALEVSVLRIVRRRRRPGQERAARQRELRAPLDRRRLGGLVAAIFYGALVEVATTAQPAHRTVTHALGDLAHVVLRRRRRGVEAHRAGVGLLEDAVDAKRVQVRMNVETAAEKLRAANRARLGAVDAREPPGQARDLFGEDPIHRAGRTGLGSGVVRTTGARIDWASLMKRVFREDVLACPCGGRRRVIADIQDRDVIVAILGHLGLPPLAPRLAPARDPTFAFE
jgi:hypothetical protein